MTALLAASISHDTVSMEEVLKKDFEAVEAAREHARQIHAGQVDKAGRPYADHLERVLALATHMRPDLSADSRRAALLHDAVEDGKVSMRELRAIGYGPGVTVLIHWLTRDPSTGETYIEWIRKLAMGAPIDAVIIKLADVLDNSNPERMALLSSQDQSLSDRYRRARKILIEEVLRRTGWERQDLDLPEWAYHGLW